MAATTVALVPLAGGDLQSGTAAMLGAGMLCYQFAIGVTNDLADRELDARSGRAKPIADGRISAGAARRLAAVLIAAGLLATVALPLAAFMVGIAGLGCGLVYNAGLKRTVLSWLPLSIALPLVPVWVFLAVDRWETFLLWVLPVGAILGFALHAANQLPDVAADRRAGVTGSLHRMPARTVRLVAIGTFGVGASLAVIVLLGRDLELAMYGAGIAAAVAMLTRWTPRSGGRGLLFPLLAVGTAALSIVFLAAA